MIHEYKINEIFESIDGEINTFHQGRVSTFIRLSGCNLNCSYCDTKYHKKFKHMVLPDIVEVLCKRFWPKKITITGGEPLCNPYIGELIVSLRNWGLVEYGDRTNFSLETNGTIPFTAVPRYVNLIVDYKLPSAEVKLDEDYIEKFYQLCETDIVKFVISNYQDFKTAFNAYLKIKEYTNPVFAFSPISGKMEPNTLIKWLKVHSIDGVFNLQLHKIVGEK